MSESQRQVKRWENGLNEWDFQKETAKANPELLQNFGRDQLTYTPETYKLSNMYWRYNEAGLSHGYPATSWFQLAIVYACGLYTAREQGIVKKGIYFQKYWKHHYFDWTTFLVRSTKFGLVGGLIGGTVLFGNPSLAIRRAVSKYYYWLGFKRQDVRDNESNWHVKFNN